VIIKRSPLSVAVGVSLLVSCGFLGCSELMAETARKPVISCADIVIVGRVTDQSYAELPASLNGINVDVSWTLHVKVKTVLKGVAPDHKITVIVTANARVRQDRDLLFNLKRLENGRYAWEQSESDCER